MEGIAKKPHHLSAEGRALRAQEEAEKLAAEQIEVIEEKVVEKEEFNEPSVPMSQVKDIVAQMLQEQLANLPKTTQVVEKIVEKPTEVYAPLKTKEENYDEIPGLEDFEVKDRMYVLCDNFKPLSRGIRNRSKPNSTLTYLNPKTKTTHSLRYSVNQISFFEDKQKGDVRVSPIEFIDGGLRTSKNEIPLQKFLAIHPDNKANGGSIFEEYDPAKDAKAEIEKEDKLYEAQSLVRSLSFLKQDAVARMMCEDYKETWVPDELKRSLYSAVVKSPEKFLKLANDTSLEAKGVAKTALFRGIITYSNYKWLNERKDVLVEVSRNEDEYDAIANYLLSGKGISFYEFLKNAI